MSITFRITTAADLGRPPIAFVGARELAAFRRLLRDFEQRLATPLIIAGEDDGTDLNRFDARVCPLPLAAMAQAFDYRIEPIQVLEEAQFRVRRIAIEYDEATIANSMRVSIVSDLGVELALEQTESISLLESLGLRPEPHGVIPVHEMRERIGSPAIRRRLSRNELDGLIPPLQRLIASGSIDDSSRFEWA